MPCDYFAFYNDSDDVGNRPDQATLCRRKQCCQRLQPEIDGLGPGACERACMFGVSTSIFVGVVGG